MEDENSNGCCRRSAILLAILTFLLLNFAGLMLEQPDNNTDGLEVYVELLRKLRSIDAQLEKAKPEDKPRLIM